jgi:hypothetical protein
MRDHRAFALCFWVGVLSGLMCNCGSSDSQQPAGGGSGGAVIHGDGSVDDQSSDAPSSVDGSAGSNPDGATSAEGGDFALACQAYCAQTKAGSCRGRDEPTCLGRCMRAVVSSACRALWEDALSCGAQTGQFGCDARFNPILSNCTSETSDFADCVQAGVVPSPDGGTCGIYSSVPDPVCDACLNRACCQEQSDCHFDKACIALLNCYGSCSDEACQTQCDADHAAGKAHSDAFYTCVDTKCFFSC